MCFQKLLTKWKKLFSLPSYDVAKLGICTGSTKGFSKLKNAYEFWSEHPNMAIFGQVSNKNETKKAVGSRFSISFHFFTGFWSFLGSKSSKSLI